MYRKIFIVALLCGFCLPACLQAQTTEKNTDHYAVSFEPNHLLNGGLRVNLEKSISSKNWIELNLTGYYLPRRDEQSANNDYFYWWDDGYRTSNSDFEKIAGLSGMGIGLTHKHYFSFPLTIHTALSYNRYNVSYTGYEFYSYQEDGLTFYDYMWADTQQSFHKLALHIAVGVRSTIRHAVFAEPYVGLGGAYSFYDTSKRHYNNTMFGYGYRGIYLTAGVKLGVN